MSAKWADGPPTRQGLYWYQGDHHTRAKLAVVTRGGDGTLYADVMRRRPGSCERGWSVYPVGCMGGRWSRRLPGRPPATPKSPAPV